MYLREWWKVMLRGLKGRVLCSMPSSFVEERKFVLILVPPYDKNMNKLLKLDF